MHATAAKNIIVQFLTNTPLMIAVLSIALALVFESLYAQDRDLPVRSKLLNMCNLLFICIANFALVYGLSDWFGRMRIGLIDLRFANDTIFTSMLSILVLLFISDMFYYAYHRMMHEVPHLWDIHAVHHSETSFNVTMAVRRHWLEDPMQAVLISLPMLFLFRLPTIDIPAALLIYSFHVYFTHMNVRLELGRYSWIITAPQLHRLHHSVLREHWDTNYAQVFPVIDIVLGTYVAPKPKEFAPTGLSSGERVETVRHLLFWPFLQWKNKLKKR